ncbi:periplasmic heavy metal sensor [Desulfobacterales bacterium HSG16]|nr:periplasmic heavy metal sensor [Desulfobacterales bacterium HSG16]
MKKHVLKLTALSAVIFLSVFATQAMAWKGMGKGGCGGGGYKGTQQGAGTQQGYGCQAAVADMTEEQIKQIADERKAFFSQTAELKQQILVKQTELAAIMVKKEADMESAVAVQKEISELQGQFDIKRLEHMAEMKKINPNCDGGMYKMGRGGKGCSGRTQKMGCQANQTRQQGCW